MADSIELLTAITDAEDIAVFTVPLVYVKGKTILTLNSSNRMDYRQRMGVKNKYKKIIEPIIDELCEFSDDNQHLVLQIVFSDRRKRDLDNSGIYVLKWVQDALVEQGKLKDDKNISFTFLPPISNPLLDEHYCKITAIDLDKNKFLKKVEKDEGKRIK